MTVQAPTALPGICVETPDGIFNILARGPHVLASGWTEDIAALVQLIHPTLRQEAAADHDDAAAEEVLRNASAAVSAFYNGDFRAPTEVPVLQRSGPFREHAWSVLRTVAPGHPVTYREYASAAGSPAAVRAAAGACAMNAAALFVPCHRVTRTDGTLGGFRYGLALKKSLLDRESGR